MASASDTALLSAVVRAIRAEGRAERTIVDPRPLRADTSLFNVARDNFVPLSPAALQQREAALRSSGVEPGDAVVRRVGSCPGLIYPTPEDRDVKRSCPREQIYVVAIGLARRGTARLPAGAVYSRDAHAAAEGYWAVRVVGRVVGPGAASETHYDYIMRRGDTGWAFATRVPLFTSD